MQVAVFHPGTQHSWQTAFALQQLGLLEWYATSIFYKPDEWPYALERVLPRRLAERLHAEFRRFSHPGLDPALVRTGGMAEWAERLAGRAGLGRLSGWIDRLGNRRFVEQIAAEIRSQRPFALWGYNGSSLTSFALGKAEGRRCILDRTNGDFAVYNAMMAEIADTYGDWFSEAQRAIPERVIADDRQEYALADAILVGSPFAASTIRQAVPDPQVQAKLQVLNYCYDEALFEHLGPPEPTPRDRPVRFLFMGLVIPRKGIQHLLEAIARIPASAAELTVVGNMQIPREVFARYADRVTYCPTVARADVPAIMASHDVLVLPSYFEGAGIVLYEALAAGCGLIQSDRCAMAVTPQTGILLDRLDSDSVHAAMMTAIEDRDRLNGWRAAAQAEARNYSFARYRQNIGAFLTRLES
ncbi:glycosyltransferase family 4 protein [Novosphingobium sp.]|uniref:glycosyltransferase family 4 protein n=1 Tax=Novosphingobium sp. TaxID=1874826 RepID=UPI0035B3FC4E